jgi:transcription factor SPT20
VPYPKQNQIKSEVNDSSKSDLPEKKPDADSADSTKPAETSIAGNANDAEKQIEHKSKVFTTVLHPTPLSLQAELTYLSTTPHPHANVNSAANKKQPPSTQPQTKTASGQPPAKRQKMLVDPEDLPKFEATLIRAVAPPVYLDPVDSFESAQELLKLMESPLHCARPPSPKRRKRTVAELAADEALAAEEERFMLIMDERLEPATSGAAAGAKIAVDDTAGAVPFEPRFSRFKTIENIRMQHEEKAKREHEKKLQQEQAKRQQQAEAERERRRLLEQRQAEELAKEERRQQLAAQQAQAQLAAQQQQRLANGLAQVSQGQMSSPVVRNQTPHATSSPVVGSGMGTQGGVSMSMTASAQGAGSPPRPPSTMQHAHPGVMGHPMAPSRSQQSQSRNGTPQMTQGTPAMSHATPIMRNVTPTQRMAHGSPPNTTITQTPVMGNAMMGTPQMAGMGIQMTPQQQQLLLQQRQQAMMAQQQGLTPQQFAQLQAQQNIQNHQHQQQLLNQQQQAQQNQMGQQHQLQQMQSHQAYQAQLIRNQMAQMQMAQHKQTQQQQGGMQMTPQQQQQQQQQMLIAAAQANANQGQVPQNPQQARYQQMFKQRLQLMRADMQKRLQSQYGTPQQYPPPVAQQYYAGLENNARAWVQDLMRRENMQQQQRQAALLQQHQQQQMMANGMGK